MVRRLPASGATRAEQRELQRQLGRHLACAAAARLLGCAPALVGVAGGGDTRPVVQRGGRADGTVMLAISHSGPWACAAATRAPGSIGVDVQQASARPAGRLVRHLGWQDWLAGRDDDDLRDRFTQAWTLWEATAKCEDAEVLAATNAAFSTLLPGLRPGVPGKWQAGAYRASSVRLETDCWLTVVVRDAGSAVPAGDSLTPHAAHD